MSDDLWDATSKVAGAETKSNDHWLHIAKGVYEHEATIQRSRLRSNPTRFNPNETPDNKNEKIFCFLFNNIALGKTPDQAV